MSGGGGKGGSETTQTEVPDWIKQPAIRNLQRAEDVQRIEYMPYRGPEVAAFNATQNAAMNNNIGAAEAFGLLQPNHGLTATTGMPTPTDFNGFSGYSSMPIYDQALADTKAAQPGAVAQYDALFGANVPTQRNYGGGRGGGNVSFNVGGNTPTGGNFTPNYNSPHFQSKAHLDQISPNSTVSESDNAYRMNKGSGTDYKAIVAGMKQQDNYEQAAGIGAYKPSPFRGNPHMGK